MPESFEQITQRLMAEGRELAEPAQGPIRDEPPVTGGGGYVPRKGLLSGRFGEWVREVIQGQDAFSKLFRWLFRGTLRVEAENDCDTLYQMFLGARQGARVEIADKMLGLGCPQIIKEVQAAKTLADIAEDPSEYIGNIMRGFMGHPVANELAEIAGSVVFDGLMSMATGGTAAIGGSLAERIRRFIGTVSIMTIGPKVLGSITEGLSLGQIHTVGGMFTDAYFNLGLGFITWQMTGPILEHGIGHELELVLKRHYRPTRFTLSQMRDLYALGQLSGGEMAETLADLGWRDADIKKVIALGFRPLSESKVLGLWRKGIIGDGECMTRLRSLGYAPDSISLIMQMSSDDDEDETRQVLLGTVRRAFRESLIGEPRFRSLLSDLGFVGEAIELEVAVYSLLKEEDARRLSVGALRDAYILDVIGGIEAKVGLMAIGFEDYDINVMLRTWEAAKEPAVLRLNKTTIINAYMNGVIGRDGAYAKLREVGYEAEDADMILATAEAMDISPPPKASIGMMIEAVKAGIITEGDFIADLRERKTEPLDMRIFVGFLFHGPARELSAGFIVKAWQGGLLAYHAAAGRLETAGWSLDDINLMLQQPKVDLNPWYIINAYHVGAIDKGDAEGLLHDLGYQAFQIDIMLTKQPVEISPWYIVHAYIINQLSFDEALLRLTDMGFSSEDAKIMLAKPDDMELPDFPSEPIQLGIGFIMAATRDGLIGIEEFKERSKGRGYTTRDIDLMVDAIEYREAPKLDRALIERAYINGPLSREGALTFLLELGYTQSDSELILQSLEKNMPDVQPRPGVGTLVGAARDGIISANELRSRLLLYGFEARDIEVYVQLARTQPTEKLRHLTKSEILKGYEGFLFRRGETIRRLMRLGYPIEEADILVRLTKHDPEDTEIHQLYRRGVLDEETAAAALLGLKYSEVEVAEYFRVHGRKE